MEALLAQPSGGALLDRKHSQCRQSNFSKKGPARVGQYPGIGASGTYDMAGNVKEWCSNESEDGLRFTERGAWNLAVLHGTGSMHRGERLPAVTKTRCRTGAFSRTERTSGYRTFVVQDVP